MRHVEPIGAALLILPIERAVRSLHEGEYLFHRGSPVEQLYVIEYGRCRMERTTYDGRTLRLAEFGPGQVIADGSLFHQHYGGDCRLTTPSTLAAFPADAVLKLLGEQHTLTQKWLGSRAQQGMELRTRL